MKVRILDAGDASAYQSLRLVALQECPAAFASSFDEEVGLSLETVAERLTPSVDGGVLGGFEDDRLVGVVGIHREPFVKLGHKANVWGMYVAAPARRGGAGRRLLGEALAFAARQLRVRQVNLGVNVANIAAVGLYEQAGFRPFGLETCFMLLDGVAQDEMHMVCVIDGDGDG